MTTRTLIACIVCIAAIVVAATALPTVTTAQAATCSDYPNQAAAQRAHDTRDADGDGIYCDALPCPCVNGDGGGAPQHHATQRPTTTACARPRRTVRISFSATRYPHIRRHFRAALRHGWPRTLVVNRPGADARRERLLSGVPTRPGMDRDEYPPAIGRGRGAQLVRGSDPRGWRADVAYVPSSENRSHGSTLGLKLRRFCDGARFRYSFY